MILVRKMSKKNTKHFGRVSLNVRNADILRILVQLQDIFIFGVRVFVVVIRIKYRQTAENTTKARKKSNVNVVYNVQIKGCQRQRRNFKRSLTQKDIQIKAPESRQRNVQCREKRIISKMLYRLLNFVKIINRIQNYHVSGYSKTREQQITVIQINCIQFKGSPQYWFL